jgi:DNA-directed RNA polymerase specialized sigma24 family protein
MTSTSEDLRQLDEIAFGARVERHRRELHVHCYRMLGWFEESEDLVQETFLRAWRRRESYAGRASGARVAVPDRHQCLPRRA